MRDEYMEIRLQNWGRWKHGAGAGGLGYAKVGSFERVDGGGEAESVVPVLECDAQDTDKAVLALPSELRATVEVVYVLGGTMASKARRLACGESTVYARLDRAHPLLRAHLVEIERKRKAARAHVEALQQAARPRGEF